MKGRRKATHDLLSPKFATKKQRQAAARKKEAGVPPVPPSVNNYVVNKPRMARSLNIQPMLPKPRVTAETEGMPAVNGKSGKEVVAKAVTKTLPKEPVVDAKSAAIQQPSEKISARKGSAKSGGRRKSKESS